MHYTTRKTLVDLIVMAFGERNRDAVKAIVAAAVAELQAQSKGTIRILQDVQASPASWTRTLVGLQVQEAEKHGRTAQEIERAFKRALGLPV